MGLSLLHVREDFARFCDEIGLTPEIRATAPNHAEVPTDDKWLRNFRIGPSEIEGNGTIAARDIAAGEIVGPAWSPDRKRAVLGCMGNHSPTPNAEMFFNSDGVWLVAREGISRGQEITTNYRHTMERWNAHE